MPDALPPRHKAPRRTAQRILDMALVLFNRYGEPEVSTQRLAAALHISPGKLHYHYPAKALLVEALFDHYLAAQTALVGQAPQVHDPTTLHAWLRELVALAWDYRFLQRDQNELLTRNHRLETQWPAATQALEHALHDTLVRLALPADPAQRPALLATLTLLLGQWLSRDFLLDPRHALDDDQLDAAEARVLGQLQGLLALAGALPPPPPPT
ncbi:MAG: TetR/AcrR family transcriptional regulator [Burkholderiales bacterium]